MDRLGRVLGPGQVTHLDDPALDVATRSIRSFLSEGRPDEPFSMLVLSSHGLPGADGLLRLAMRDTREPDPDRTSLAVDTVLRWAAESEGPVLVVVDSSSSGLAMRSVGPELFKGRRRAPQAFAVWTSSAASERTGGSGDAADFLGLLADALAGGAIPQTPDGRIGLEELHVHLLKSMAVAGMPQQPQLSISGDPGAFVFQLPSMARDSAAPLQQQVPPQAQRARSGTEPEPQVLSPDVELDEQCRALLLRADGVRRAAHRDLGEPLDVILGALAGARSPTLGLWTAPYLVEVLQSLGSADRPLDQILDQVQQRFGLADLPEVLTTDLASMTPADLLPQAPIVSYAETIARRTGATARIEQSHLLAAALVTTELPADLVDLLGSDRADLSARLLDAVTKEPSAGDAGAWAAVLAPADLAANFTSDYVPARARLQGRPRPPDLPDRLGVDVYVTMLAALITRRTTAMPVSIGLFGEWGSGKSYFMELLRQKVDRLSAADAPGVYCQDVVQITFNAWSYADTNLWASLAADFFNQLAGPADPDDVRRRKIKESLKDKNKLREELESAREAAKERAAGARTDYAKATAARQDSSRRFKAGMVKAVLADEGVQARIRELGGVLGPGQRSYERILDVAQDVQGIGSDLAATRRVLAQRSLRWPFFFLLLAIAAVSAVVLLPDGPLPWLKSGGAMASVLAFLTAFGVAVGRSRQAVSGLREVAEAAASVRDELISKGGDEEVDRTAGALRQAEAEEAAAQAQLLELDATIAQLDRQLEEYEPGRRLYQFIAERAASLDYRGQLGVVSSVRHDFEELVELMRQWRAEPGTPATDRKPIDRIVLYIDDLDRCEPEQVVQVLQAVHLLLAMDLFVVVVGVDPRWLLRALRTRYAGILGMDAEDGRADDLGFAASTPQDYLEKIFQVPFVLPPMTREAFKELITSFLPRGATTQRTGSTSGISPGATPPSEPASGPTDRGAKRMEPAAVPPPDTRSEIAPSMAGTGTAPPLSLAPITSVPVTKRELDLLSALAPLVRTPRAATRMFNIYGLLRSARDLTPGARFLGSRDRPGDYEAVIQLLGILTAAPQLLGPILWGDPADEQDGQAFGLCRMHGPGSWASFVDSLDPQQQVSGHWANAVLTSIEPEDVQPWHDLVVDLRDIGGRIQLDDIERYRLWGPQVARFSFQVSAAP